MWQQQQQDQLQQRSNDSSARGEEQTNNDVVGRTGKKEFEAPKGFSSQGQPAGFSRRRKLSDAPRACLPACAAANLRPLASSCRVGSAGGGVRAGCETSALVGFNVLVCCLNDAFFAEGPLIVMEGVGPVSDEKSSSGRRKKKKVERT